MLKANVRNNMILGKKIIYGAILCISLSGCGGGGDAAAPSGLTYTGLTTQANLTVENGEQISTSSYQNGGSGEGMGTTFTSLSEIEADVAMVKPRTSTLAKVLVAAVNKIEPSSSDTFFSGAVITESGDPIKGDCGGEASFTMSTDDVTGDFSGTMAFNSYCESGETINGSITISGNINVNAGTFNSMTMTMTSVSVTSGSETSLMDGTLSFNPGATPAVITMNMKLKAGSDDVFWMENFTLTIAEVTGGDDLTMEGRFYHPSYGYVDITTPTAFHYSGLNQYPFPGTMVTAGSNGSVVTLTSLSTTTYKIDIDTDGNGNIDHSDNGLWAEL